MNYEKFHKRRRLYALIAAGILGVSTTVLAVEAVEESEPVDLSGIGSLKGIQPAAVSGLYDYVKDKDAAIKLGKAFFWDMQAGSRGQSCASCHFSAGADNRSKNQISPGLRHTDPAKREIFDPTLSGGKGGPNYSLVPSDFPFRLYANPDDRHSAVLFDSDDVVSSQGIHSAVFNDLFTTSYDPQFGDRREDCTNVKDIFHVNDIGVRRVEPRNTPTVINAIFNFRNFWDGRANNNFNGVDPFGPRNKDARIMHFDRGTGKISLKEVNLKNSSAASQAVGPPGSDFEMTCSTKAFQTMGKKLLRLVPLGLQQVDHTDSELGALTASPSKGLRTSYRKMIQEAFHDDLWSYGRKVDGYEQIEHNFSLFWGLAIQLYEATLISDDSRFDRYMDGDHEALTEQEIYGMELFVTKGKCVNCHNGPEFSAAATHLIAEDEEEGLVERMLMGDNKVALYDNGFYNIGVRPTKEDILVGGVDPWGNPLSHTRQEQQRAAGQDVHDHFEVDPNTFEEDPGVPVSPTERNAVDGAAKTSILRNVELTAPYMHNGSMKSLEEVINFYNRGGNRTGDHSLDSTGFGDNTSNLDPDIRSLGLDEEEKAALVAFLKSLTDERVRWEQAPFDHPQLFVPNGATGDEYAVIDSGTGIAEEEWLEVPAVGAAGRAAKGLGPIDLFLEDANVSTVEANDDDTSVKYRASVVINVVANDDAGASSIDAATVEVVSGPDSRIGRLINNGDGTLTYTAIRNTDASFTYQVKDSEGNPSNVATVNIDVFR
ncbi:cytochrome c peroxidase [Photobacterium nomapromontoriensis]|uniref:cytochrome c peroxidase n=1 Tax=Photobacterium nomapromontoriensis TaxID=2910237 RepID=UPI003D0C2EF4